MTTAPKVTLFPADSPYGFDFSHGKSYLRRNCIRPAGEPPAGSANEFRGGGRNTRNHPPLGRPRSGRVGDEDRARPTLIIYVPRSFTSNGIEIVIAPGSGYGHLNHEGRQVANWLNALGITSFCSEVPAGAALSSCHRVERCAASPAYGAIPGARIPYPAESGRHDGFLSWWASGIKRGDSF
jgi:hypothetical protein